MTKILAASDIHGDRKAIERIVKRAGENKVDVVVLCGDILLSDFDADNMVGLLADNGIETLIIPGNHETDATVEFLSALYKPLIKNIHCKTHVKNDVGFFGCGGANIGLFQLDDAYTKNKLKYSHEIIKNLNKKIMVTHAPPFDTKVDDLGVPAGSEGVREAIEELQPDLCLCGHIHETAGLTDRIGRTKIINVGKNGVIIDI
ncbi:MAG: metallophosphoesterase [Candidatus Nanoarchaeia archaeon]|nr:metallophosphoesterase [Candidatus Nanoarchaeia archaeon]